MFRTPKIEEFFNRPVIPHFIDGEWHLGEARKVIAVTNPSEGAVMAHVADGGAGDVDKAVRAANSAFPKWAETNPKERATVLRRLADEIDSHVTDLALLESLNVGKAITTASAFDIPFGANCLRYYADLIVGRVVDTKLDLSELDARIHRTPYGVCGFILPWNFPFDLLLWGIAPALAAGNTVVVKPSEITPLTALALCRLAIEAGVPSGVINVVNGDGSEAGVALTMHPLVRRISFTGSVTVGREVAEKCGKRLIPCKLELGGKGAAVVFEDVDIAATAQKLAQAITLNTGQVCCTASRWIIQEEIFDDFVEGAIEALKRIKIGPGPETATEMGPLASKSHHERVVNHLDRGIAEGARVLWQGETPRVEGHEGGYYVSPSLLTGDPENLCCREEIFGPSAFLLSFKTEEEAVQLVNKSEYGLANSVWSSNLARANAVAEKLNAGNVWINAHNVFAYGLPYGGLNMSGIGGGVNGPETLDNYLRPTSIARPLL